MSVGEKLSPELALQWKDTCRLLNGYGPTEASIHTHCFVVSDVTDEQQIEHNVPIGQPISNSKTYIVDEQLQLLPIGVVGEICVSGVDIAKVYLNREACLLWSMA